jgi:hypothetical protein
MRVPSGQIMRLLGKAVWESNDPKRKRKKDMAQRWIEHLTLAN